MDLGMGDAANIVQLILGYTWNCSLTFLGQININSTTAIVGVMYCALDATPR